MECTIFQLFGPCRQDEHDECAGEHLVGLNDGMQGATGHWLTCACECHGEWEPDAAYEAGYAYAAGYHD